MSRGFCPLPPALLGRQTTTTTWCVLQKWCCFYFMSSQTNIVNGWQHEVSTFVRCSEWPLVPSQCFYEYKLFELVKWCVVWLLLHGGTFWEQREVCLRMRMLSLGCQSTIYWYMVFYGEKASKWQSVATSLSECFPQADSVKDVSWFLWWYLIALCLVWNEKGRSIP